MAIKINNINYTGAFQTSTITTVAPPIDILVVGGGAGGGGSAGGAGGGGGAGGIITSNAVSTVKNTVYTVTIGSGGAVDTNGNNSTLSASTNYSAQFTGTNRLTIANNTALNMEGGDFTIECWYYPTSTPTTNGLFSKRANNSTISGVGVYFFNSLAPILLATNNGSAWQINAASSVSCTLNSWNHIAVTRSGNTWRLFVNGIQGLSTTLSGTVQTNAASFAIGAHAADGLNPINSSYISNFRVVKGTALYTAAFSPPLVPLSAVSNTSLLTLQSSTLVDNSPNAFTITSSGTTNISTLNPGYNAFGGGTGGRFVAYNIGTNASTGASGGGGASVYINTATTPGSGITSQGNAGGAALGWQSAGQNYSAGGGGGAGAVGGTAQTTKAGNGGVGIQSSITGSNVFYGGGGGGGRITERGSSTIATGGSGGGGNGFMGASVAVAGTANTGGGGGGGAAAGGSGVIIIRHLDTFSTGVTTGNPTVVKSGGYVVYTFTSSGTIVWY